MLGPLSVRRNGVEVAMPSPTHRRIVAALAQAGGGPVPLARMVEAVWGDDPPPSAPATLQSHVSRLRRVLGAGQPMTTDHGYTLPAVVDVARFEPLTTAASVEGLAEALGLVRGEPYQDLADVEAFLGERRRLQELIRATRVRLCTALIEAGRPEEAVPEMERMVEDEPLYEPGWLALARALHAARRQAEAIECLDRYRRRLGGVGLEPGPAVTEIEDLIFSPPPGVAPTLPGLPARRVELVGRDAELDALGRLLAGHRLVTITGPGGMGKTSLALEASRRAEHHHPGGATVVDLSEILDEGGVLDAVARSLGVRGGDDTWTTMLRSLAGPSRLVVLDNCEHVRSTVADLADRLLDGAPSVTVLVTSREPLGLPDEARLPLEGLDIEGAARLFVHRATAIDPRFEDDEVVVKLCERLDGMPLAIEMAAARMRANTPAELLRRLEEGAVLDTNRGGGRHQSLDSLVAWSYRLLGADERRMFEELSVFGGGFDAADAAVVDVADPPAVIDRLVDRSLLAAAREGDSTTYRMLETVRGFARARLAESGRGVEARHRHAHRVAELVAECEAGLCGPDEADWARRLEGALGDVGSAHAWALRQGDLDLQYRLVAPLFEYVQLRLPPGPERWAAATLAAHPGEPHPLRPAASGLVAAHALAGGRFDEATALVAAGDERTWPALLVASDLALYVGDLEGGRRATEALLEVAAATGRDSVMVGGLVNLSLITSFGGGDGRPEAAEAVRRARAIGSPTLRGLAAYTAGEAEPEPDEALVRFAEASALARTVANTFVEALAEVAAGSRLTRLGRVEGALDHLERAIVLWRAMGDLTHQWTTLRNLIILLDALGADADAALLLGATTGGGAPTYGVESEDLERVEGAARRRLGPTFEHHRAAGWGLTPDQVVETALQAITRARGG